MSVLAGGRRCASARIPNLSPAIALEGDEFPEAALEVYHRHIEHHKNDA